MQINIKNIAKIVLDAVMALIFAILFNKSALGGMTFHEIAGLAVGAFIVFHMVLNRAWLKGVTKKLFDKKLPARTRVAYIVDALLLLSLAVIIITGILMSKVLFPNLFNISLNVEGLHKSVSYLALLLIGAHLGLSWNRVVAIMKKLLRLPKKKAFGAVATVFAIAVFALGSSNIVATGYFDKLAAISSSFSEEERGGKGNGSGAENGETADETAADITSSGTFASGITADTVSSASITEISGSDTALSGGEAASGYTADTNDATLTESGTGSGAHNGSGKNGGIKDEGGQGSANVLATIYQNLSIMAAFAVFTYYIDKLLRRKPKKTGEHNVA